MNRVSKRTKQAHYTQSWLQAPLTPWPPRTCKSWSTKPGKTLYTTGFIRRKPSLSQDKALIAIPLAVAAPTLAWLLPRIRARLEIYPLQDIKQKKNSCLIGLYLSIEAECLIKVVWRLIGRSLIGNLVWDRLGRDLWIGASRLGVLIGSLDWDIEGADVGFYWVRTNWTPHWAPICGTDGQWWTSSGESDLLRLIWRTTPMSLSGDVC